MTEKREKLNLYIAKVLAYLYDNPVIANMKTHNIVEKEDMDKEIFETYYDPESFKNLQLGEPNYEDNIVPQDRVYNMLCAGAIWWLKDEGFITFTKPDEKSTTKYGGVFFEVAITNKGLAALEKEVLNNGKNRRAIDIIKEAAINNVVGTLMNLPIMLYPALA
ncbi:MAG: hypothetical protein LBL65_05625 [Campylobacteraceae bacterium]|nr:hypothetical protein [Campylobacteraceae bacterium]